MIEQHETVTHAVVPAAGRGTRFLPITQSVPKEMLPNVGRPTIDGRYICDPIVVDELTHITPGAGGEYQLTDACARLIVTPCENGGGLYGIIIDEPRYDTGDKLGYLRATIAFALTDPDMGPALREYLNTQPNEA